MRFGGHDLVFPVLFLHHGREPNGPLQILELDAAHGKHHYLQQPVGHRLERVEGRWPTRRLVASLSTASARRLDCDRGIRKLCGIAALTRTQSSSWCGEYA